jgi:hypothetical protein
VWETNASSPWEHALCESVDASVKNCEITAYAGGYGVRYLNDGWTFSFSAVYYILDCSTLDSPFYEVAVGHTDAAVTVEDGPLSAFLTYCYLATLTEEARHSRVHVEDFDCFLADLATALRRYSAVQKKDEVTVPTEGVVEDLEQTTNFSEGFDIATPPGMCLTIVCRFPGGADLAGETGEDSTHGTEMGDSSTEQLAIGNQITKLETIVKGLHSFIKDAEAGKWVSDEQHQTLKQAHTQLQEKLNNTENEVTVARLEASEWKDKYDALLAAVRGIANDST